MTASPPFENILADIAAGRLREAAESCRRILTAQPHDRRALQLLGAVTLGQGDGAAALPFLRHSLALEPGAAVTHRYLARAWQQAGLGIEAAHAFARVADLDPDDGGSQIARGAILARLRFWQDAAVALRAGVARNPDDWEAQHNLATALGELGHWAEAAKAYAAIARLRPNKPKSWALLGLAQRHAENWSAASAAFRRAIDLEPALVQFHYQLAQCSFRCGQLDEARRAVAHARAMKPGESRYHLLAGHIDFEAGLPAAAEYFARARELSADRRVTGRLVGFERRTVRDYCRDHDLPYVAMAPEREVNLRAGRADSPHAYRLPERFLAQIRNATILTDNFAVLTDDGIALVDSVIVSTMTPPDAMGGFPYLNHDRLIAEIPDAAAADLDEAVLLGGGANFYHAVMDWLSRAPIIAGNQRLREMPVIAARALPAAARELCVRLGIPRKRLHFVDGGQRLRVGRLWLPALAQDKAGYADPDYVSVLQRCARAIAKPGGRTRRLYLSRAGHHRSLRNEAELRGPLAARGFEIVNVGGLSWAKQTRLFADAELIVGVHGAGLTNLVFAPENAGVIEICHSHAQHPMYAILAAITGLRYRRLPADPIRREGIALLHADCQVDFAALLAAIDEMIADVAA